MSNANGDDSSDSDNDELREFLRIYNRVTGSASQPTAQEQGNVNSENGSNNDINISNTDLRTYFQTFSPNLDVQPSTSTQALGNANSVLGRNVPIRFFDPVINRPLRGSGDLNSIYNEGQRLEDLSAYYPDYYPLFDLTPASTEASGNADRWVLGVLPRNETPDLGYVIIDEDEGEETLEELRDYFRNISPNFDIEIDPSEQTQRTPRSESGDSDPPRYFPVSTPSTSSSAASLDDTALTNLFADLAIIAQQSANMEGTQYRLQIPPHIIGNLVGENNAPSNPLPQTAWIEATAGSQEPIIDWTEPPVQIPQEQVATIALVLIIVLVILSNQRYYLIY